VRKGKGEDQFVGVALIKLKGISHPFPPNLKLQLSPTILLCTVRANEILRIPFKRLPVGCALVRALCAATLHPQMSRAAARRSCMLAAAEFYPDYRPERSLGWPGRKL